MLDLLQTLAEIAIALAGFSGVVVAFGGRNKSLPSFRLSLLLSLSGEVALFSLIPMLLLIKFDEPKTWTIAGTLYGLVHLSHVAFSFFESRREQTTIGIPKIDLVLMVIGASLSSSLLYLSLGGETLNVQIVYGGLLVFVLSVAGAQFFRLLMALRSQRSANDT